MGRTAYLAWVSDNTAGAGGGFLEGPAGNLSRVRTRGERMLGVYAGLGVSLLLALLFGKADRR
jgi:NAD(P)H-flavin reductase